ncbi:MAG TPA: c-type cytochrome [Gammaproteobacteria bacterium]|nr:c-type cytochrome [Gammaproteobacteria bacterium]
MNPRVVIAFAVAAGLFLSAPLATAATGAPSGTPSHAPWQNPNLSGFARHVVSCAACHGSNGEGGGKDAPFVPRLAGLSASYLLQQLQDFRDGKRQYQVMNYMTHGLPNDYLAKIATYFSSKSGHFAHPAAGEPSRTQVELGRRIALEGIKSRGIPSCASCHGTDLSGDPSHSAPALAGQYEVYLDWQMRQYKDGERTNGTVEMPAIADHMTTQEMSAVSAYLASIRPQQVNSASARAASVPASPAAAKQPAMYPVKGKQTALTRRGRYLATAGDCAGCHTSSPDQPFAGGLPLETPFGTIFTPNITPDKATGIGKWSFKEFYTAMHDGLGPGHEFLYPAFPFVDFSNVTRSDVRAIYAYLQTLTPIHKKDMGNKLRFPYNIRPMLFGWRLLFFHPHTFEPDKNHSAAWNRGAYLVKGLGHCEACHSPRGIMGEVKQGQALAGGTVQGWHVPNITDNPRYGLSNWSIGDITHFLRTGDSPHVTAAMGPMRDVIHDSLQYLTRGDLRAMAIFLKSLNREAPEVSNVSESEEVTPKNPYSGKHVYEQNCSGCHQDDGGGVTGEFPPLAGNPMVQEDNPRDAIRMVLRGGFQAHTKSQPEPYSMPPMGDWLNNEQVAAVVSYIRTSWGNKASKVTASQVNRIR